MQKVRSSKDGSINEMSSLSPEKLETESEVEKNAVE